MSGPDDASDTDSPGFWFGLVAAIVAISGVMFQFFDRQRTARQDQVAYLQQQIADLQRANQLCEMRCEELREEMFELMARNATATKRRRQVTKTR